MDVPTNGELREILVKYNKSDEMGWDESDIEDAAECLSELIENLNEPKDLMIINGYAYEYLSTAGTRRFLYEIQGMKEWLAIRYIFDIKLYTVIHVSESQHAAVPMALLYDDYQKAIDFAMGPLDKFKEIYYGTL
jgi:hypothetical protein